MVQQSSILGGYGNSVCHNSSHIVGNQISTNRQCATFVNNLSIMNIPTTDAGLPTGAVWRCTTDNTLRIIP